MLRAPPAAGNGCGEHLRVVYIVDNALERSYQSSLTKQKGRI